MGQSFQPALLDVVIDRPAADAAGFQPGRRERAAGEEVQMRKSKFTEEKIAFALKQAESGGLVVFGDNRLLQTHDINRYVTGFDAVRIVFRASPVA